MKRVMIPGFVFVLIMTMLSGCKGADSPQTGTDESAPAKQRQSIQEEEPGKASEEPDKDDGVSLASIRKAAEASGYTVTDGHQLVFMSEVKDGISIEIDADGQNTVYSFIECETEDAAIKNAKDIDDAGYNIAVRSGQFLTCYASDKKDGSIEDILLSLMAGKTVQTQRESGISSEQPPQESSEQTSAPSGPALAEQSAAGSIAGTWSYSDISGQYNAESGVYEGISGMGIMYTFFEDGTFAQLIAFDSYIVTTGKYSIKDGILTLTDRISVESGSQGQYWYELEELPDASGYYEIGRDDTGEYLLLGQEGMAPPLEPVINAMMLNRKK